MSGTQTEQTTRRTAVFDENGQTISESEENAPELEAAPELEDGEAAAAAPEQLEGKYRIGDKKFQTQDEALAYAQSHVSALETETQIADAYRQGMRDAVSQVPGTGSNVIPAAPAAPELNVEELYTDPKAFLAKYATQIKNEALGTVQQDMQIKYESDKIWNEFTNRHPMLADFRKETEGFVSLNTPEVRAIIATKGQEAAYDWIATKLKSQFATYANAVQPKRALPNTGAGASPTSKASGVTLKAEPKKTLSFSEQIRSLKKRR